MIVVRVELHSAITREVTEIARMHISNIGGTEQHGDYIGLVYRGRDKKALDQKVVNKSSHVLGYSRLNLHVWNLVARMLNKMEYK